MTDNRDQHAVDPRGGARARANGGDTPSFDDAGVHGSSFGAAAETAAPSASDLASQIAGGEPPGGDGAYLAAPETVIDDAWAKAMAAQALDDDALSAAHQLDIAAADFIDTLLSTMLLCPVWDLEGSDEDSLAPKIVERDGIDTLVLFDTPARLEAFAAEPTEHVELPGRAFFRLLAGQDAQIALNPDVAESATVFSPETVEAIAELADAVEEETELTPDGPLTVLSPDDAPDPLLRSLAARLAAAEAVVSEAWLFTAVQEIGGTDEDGAADDPDEFRQLVIGLAAQEPRRADDLHDLASELSRIGEAASPSPFAVALFEAEDRLLAVARNVGLDLASPPGAPTRAA